MLFFDSEIQHGLGIVLTLFLVLLLAVLWGAVFIPTLLRARSFSSPTATVNMFKKTLRAMRPAQGRGNGGRWIMVPATTYPEAVRRRTLERRRRLFLTLLFAAASTLALAVVPGLRWMLWVHMFLDLVLAAFVAYLITLRRESEEFLAEPSLARVVADEREEDIILPEPEEDLYMSAGA